MKMKTTILLGFVFAALVVASVSFTAKAVDVNGPFNIVPGRCHCAGGCGSPLVLKSVEDTGTCNLNWGYSYSECCNIVITNADYCYDHAGDNCYTEDHVEGACCYTAGA